MYRNVTFDILSQLNGMDEKALEEKCLELIDATANQVFVSQHFTQIGKSTLKRIVERDTLEVPEIDVFDACLTWAKAKCELKNLEVCSCNLYGCR